MDNKMNKVVSPTPANFKLYGKVIGYPGKARKGLSRNLWRIVHVESQKIGWRIAYLVLRDKTIGRLECHPESDESFEPVAGKALLFVAHQKDVTAVRCFTLDKPVIVKKGIWHGVVTLSPETEIKITENARVRCVYWPFGFRAKILSDFKLKD